MEIIIGLIVGLFIRSLFINSDKENLDDLVSRYPHLEMYRNEWK